MGLAKQALAEMTCLLSCATRKCAVGGKAGQRGLPFFAGKLFHRRPQCLSYRRCYIDQQRLHRCLWRLESGATAQPWWVIPTNN